MYNSRVLFIIFLSPMVFTLASEQRLTYERRSYWKTRKSNMKTISFDFKFQYLLLPESAPRPAENGPAPPAIYVEVKSPLCLTAPATSMELEPSPPESMRGVRSALVPFHMEGNVTPLKRRASWVISEHAGYVSKRPKISTLQATRPCSPAGPSAADPVMSFPGGDSAQSRDMSLLARMQRYMDS
jgi:hypothetical protein